MSQDVLEQQSERMIAWAAERERRATLRAKFGRERRALRKYLELGGSLSEENHPQLGPIRRSPPGVGARMFVVTEEAYLDFIVWRDEPKLVKPRAPKPKVAE